MKLRIPHNYLLSGCVLILAVICFLSVNQPIRFDREKTRREVAVKVHLVQIRKAEEVYKAHHGAYSGSFAILIREHLLADSLQYIPFAGKKKFDLSASTIISKSGKQIPVMQCGANYGDYLTGLDENRIANLVTSATESGSFPGLKFGDIAENTDNVGNWE